VPDIFWNENSDSDILKHICVFAMKIGHGMIETESATVLVQGRILGQTSAFGAKRILSDHLVLFFVYVLFATKASR
jgi:hypothetical protein